MQPAISVVIATYKRPHLIGRALDSVLAQSMRPAEVIVVDDASDDETGDVVAAWSARTGLAVDFVAAPRNLGVGAARNIGMKRARGDYIAFLDSDDEFLPQALETLAGPLMAHDDAVVSFADGVQHWADGRPTVRMMARCLDATRDTVALDPARPEWRRLSAPQDQLLITSMIPTCAAVFRRSAAEAVDLMPEYRNGEDWIFWLKLSGVGSFVCQFVDVAVIHRQDDNLTGRHHNLAASRQNVDSLLRLLADQYGITLTTANRERIEREIEIRLADMRYWHSVEGIGVYLALLRSDQIRGTGGPLRHVLRDPRSLLRALVSGTRS